MRARLLCAGSHEEVRRADDVVCKEDEDDDVNNMRIALVGRERSQTLRRARAGRVVEERRVPLLAQIVAHRPWEPFRSAPTKPVV